MSVFEEKNYQTRQDTGSPGPQMGTPGLRVLTVTYLQITSQASSWNGPELSTFSKKKIGQKELNDTSTKVSGIEQKIEAMNRELQGLVRSTASRGG